MRRSSETGILQVGSILLRAAGMSTAGLARQMGHGSGMTGITYDRATEVTLEGAVDQVMTVPGNHAMGGMHLSGVTEKAIPRTVADLKKLKLALLAPGHCTGWRALAAMAQEFGDDVLAPSAVGQRYLI